MRGSVDGVEVVENLRGSGPYSSPRARVSCGAKNPSSSGQGQPMRSEASAAPRRILRCTLDRNDCFVLSDEHVRLENRRSTV